MVALPLSVVVPTRGRPQAVSRCLAALRAQTVRVEAIVIEDVAGRGPAWARNAGWRKARSPVVLFCDDDCIPDPDWAERLVAACPAGGSAAGATVNHDAGDPHAAASQLITSALQRGSLREDGRLGFAPSSNLAASRALLERVPFNERFHLAAGEDREWCARAGAAGAAPVFAPQAVVRHRQSLGGLGGFWRQQLRYGRGAAHLRPRVEKPELEDGKATLGVPARGAPLATPRVRLRLARAAAGAGIRVAALVALAQVAVAAGFALERRALRDEQRVAGEPGRIGSRHRGDRGRDVDQAG